MEALRSLCYERDKLDACFLFFFSVHSYVYAQYVFHLLLWERSTTYA